MVKRTAADKLIMNAYKNSSLSSGICIFCKESDIKKITIDHKNPLSRGGKTEFDNLCDCCDSCNNEKRDMTVDEYLTYRSLAKKDKDKYLKEISIKIRNEKLKNMVYGNLSLGVPKDTEKLLSIREIEIPQEYKNVKIDMKQINVIKEYLEKYYDIYNTICLSEENILLAGYKEYLAIKLTGLNVAPVKYKKSYVNKMKYNNRIVKVPIETEEIISINKLVVPKLQKQGQYYNFDMINCELFFSKYGYLDRPLLVSENLHVLEGINNYIVSKNHNLDFVPIRYLKIR